MTKIETIIVEYEHCGECIYVLDWFDTGKAGHRCEKRKRIIKELWGDIPTWCPLTNKERSEKGQE